LANKRQKTEDHMFSIELKSTGSLKNLILENNDGNNVIIDGFLGELANLSITEGLMLEIKGTEGTLRMDLNEKEIEKLLPRNKIRER
jgi:hypothetical protein